LVFLGLVFSQSFSAFDLCALLNFLHAFVARDSASSRLASASSFHGNYVPLNCNRGPRYHDAGRFESRISRAMRCSLPSSETHPVMTTTSRQPRDLATLKPGAMRIRRREPNRRTLNRQEMFKRGIPGHNATRWGRKIQIGGRWLCDEGEEAKK
jgi:hypothetical protein